jgi:hypothetical protein
MGKWDGRIEVLPHASASQVKQIASRLAHGAVAKA